MEETRPLFGNQFKNAVIGLLILATAYFYWLNEKTGSLVDHFIGLCFVGPI